MLPLLSLGVEVPALELHALVHVRLDPPGGLFARLFVELPPLRLHRSLDLGDRLGPLFVALLLEGREDRGVQHAEVRASRPPASPQ